MIDQILSHPLLALFVVITTGLLLGRVNVGGVRLGSSGVIFTALALGHLGHSIPSGVGTLGLVLFVYCVGIGAGPSFFRTFVRRGQLLAMLGIFLIVVGGLVGLGLSQLLGLPPELTVGVFAGAMTSTPALAAALEAIPSGAEVAVGYGLAYPFGVVGVVLFVQLVPRLLRVDLDRLARTSNTAESGDKIDRALVEVRNPSMVGRELDQLAFIADAGCMVSRVMVDRELQPVPRDHVLQEGQHVLVVGRSSDLDLVVEALGRRSKRTDYFLETERNRMRVVATSKQVVNRSLSDLQLRRKFGVTISRVSRHGFEFVPRGHHVVEYGELLVAIGTPDQLQQFAEHAGHRARAFEETDILSLGFGLSLGIIFGMISFSLGDSSFSLGLAGGPLLVALVLGHLGHVGPIAGHLPIASRLVLQEVGLVCFLANAGVKAGGQLLDVLTQHSAALISTAVAVAVCPMIVGFIFARYVLKLDMLQTLGGVCGGMTSTPGLGVLTARVDSDLPVASYAAVYPVALILITVAARMLAVALLH